MNHLEATKGPKGAQLEDISALDGLTPMAAQAWRASEGKMDRRRRLNVFDCRHRCLGNDCRPSLGS